MEQLQITGTLYTQILLVQISVLYTIAALCLFIKRPTNQYSKPYIKALEVYGIAMLVWGSLLLVMRSPFCSGDWTLEIRGAVLVSAFYLFVRLLFVSITLAVAPTSNLKIRSILSVWTLLTIILLLSAIASNPLYHQIAIWGVKTYTLVESIFVCYKEVKSYGKIKKELEEHYFDTNVLWIKEILVMLVIWIIIGFFISFTSMLPKSIFAIYGTVIFSYILITYSINLKKFYFLRQTGFFRSAEEETEAIAITEEEEAEEAAAIKDSKEKAAEEGKNIISSESINSIEQRISKWIEEEAYLRDIVSIEHMASYAYTNKTYLSAYINKTYGCNFRCWVASLRLGYAKKLLKENKTISVSEVAEAISYTPNGLSTIFKKHYGITISQWRNEN